MIGALVIHDITSIGGYACETWTDINEPACRIGHK